MAAALLRCLVGAVVHCGAERGFFRSLGSNISYSRYHVHLSLVIHIRNSGWSYIRDNAMAYTAPAGISGRLVGVGKRRQLNRYLSFESNYNPVSAWNYRLYFRIDCGQFSSRSAHRNLAGMVVAPVCSTNLNVALLANTESGEYLVQDFFRCRFTDDLAEASQATPQINCYQLKRHFLLSASHSILETLFCTYKGNFVSNFGDKDGIRRCGSVMDRQIVDR